VGTKRDGDTRITLLSHCPDTNVTRVLHTLSFKGCYTVAILLLKYNVVSLQVPRDMATLGLRKSPLMLSPAIMHASHNSNSSDESNGYGVRE
jgi:hypothetical protein